MTFPFHRVLHNVDRYLSKDILEGGGKIHLMEEEKNKSENASQKNMK